MKVELDVYRVWGQPKIHKPSALKGIKPAFTILFRKRKNQVYILGKDIYVYFFDLFLVHTVFPMRKIWLCRYLHFRKNILIISIISSK